MPAERGVPHGRRARCRWGWPAGSSSVQSSYRSSEPWQVGANTWLFVAPDDDRAGGGLMTLGVDSIEPFLSRWREAVLEHEPVETYGNGVRHVTIIDPDGNSVSLAEAPAQV